MRQPCTHPHARLGVLPLVDRRTKSVELGEHAALVVGDEQANLVVPVGEPLGDPSLQLLEPGAVGRRDLRRAREPVRDTPARERIEEIDLVEDELDGHLAGADLGQHPLHRAHLLVHNVLGQRGVDDVEHEVGDERLFKR